VERKTMDCKDHFLSIAQKNDLYLKCDENSRWTSNPDIEKFLFEKHKFVFYQDDVDVFYLHVGHCEDLYHKNGIENWYIENIDKFKIKSLSIPGSSTIKWGPEVRDVSFTNISIDTFRFRDIDEFKLMTRVSFIIPIDLYKSSPKIKAYIDNINKIVKYVGIGPYGGNWLR
jgi:hypothetical protein